MHYLTYEMTHALIKPMRLGTAWLQCWSNNRFNPMSYTPAGRSVSAACELFHGLTRRYAKPAFGIEQTTIAGREVAVRERVAMDKPFCELRHFECATTTDRPKVLMVAPLSGHYATLLRDTVGSMLPAHDTYITDWRDARDVPWHEGPFDLDDYIDYVIDFIHYLGNKCHVIAVCQPAVPALAATALMAADDDPDQPASLTLIGGPIDSRRNPTLVNRHAESHPLSWFEHNVIARVPFPHAGAMRRVYPGFLQLSGFVSMNLDRHVNAHVTHFHNLVRGDNDSVEKHRRFYEEYLAVMDLPAEYYLQTIKTVFQDHDLPEHRMLHRGRPVDCGAIRKTALMTIEGELDDICAVGQTQVAHELCRNVPSQNHFRHVQPDVGHYGVFNGRRWRTEIQPRIADMIRLVSH